MGNECKILIMGSERRDVASRCDLVCINTSRLYYVYKNR